MKNDKLKKALLTVIAILVWLTVWECTACIVNVTFIIPTVADTVGELFLILKAPSSYLYILMSFLRILAGLALGIVFGALLAFLMHYVKYIDIFFSPVLSVLRATPVASFVMILWMLIGSDNTPIIIAIIMVMPIITQNLLNGFASISVELREVCDIFEVSYKKRLKILILPSLKKYLIPAIITSAGLAWKSGIAAEIISYTSNSIGKEIYWAKSFAESGKMFAWTIIVIVFSIFIEKVLSLINKEVKKHDE